ncbi:MAG: ABC transporter substrate-binding protein [Planctomycetota bacterium]
MNQIKNSNPDIIVTAGARATSLVLQNIDAKPVVAFMIPNALNMSFMAPESPYKKRLACVTTDIPPKLQIDWIKQLSPKLKNVGVLYSSRSKQTTENIKSTAKSKGVNLTLIDTRKDMFPKAIETLNSKRCDGVLMIPDAGAYDSANVRRLLLWGIRQKKPVWAFSENIVKAGAFAGLYGKNEDIGRQTADLVKNIIDKNIIAKIGLQYPRNTYSAVNERTAEMIGISIERKILKKVNARYGKN